MDYWLCVYVCVFLCSHDNDSKCSHAKSQPQWNVWLIYVYLFSLNFFKHAPDTDEHPVDVSQ